MDFGKIDTAALEQADLSLPPDPPETAAVLKTGKGKTKIYLGCGKWGRKEWVGKLYPPGTKEKDFLQHYSRLFNSIEFNGFYYRLHPAETVRSWKDQVPPGFKFCPKFTQSITHYKRLKDAEREVEAFVSTVREFGEMLGPILLMPHPQMSTAHLGIIEKFVRDIPADVALSVELRHPSWYEDGYNRELYDMLRSLHRGTVITDVAGRRDCAHMRLSTPDCFIRFEGNSLHKTDYSRIDEWVQRLKSWMEQGLEQCFFFMHQHEEVHSPELLQYFVEQMNEQSGTSIPEPMSQGSAQPAKPRKASKK